MSNDAPIQEALLGGSHVALLNFKTSRVGVFKCLSLVVGFAVTVTIWLRQVVSCRDFILRPVATFWAMSLVRIYPGRASYMSVKVRSSTTYTGHYVPYSLKRVCGFFNVPQIYYMCKGL